MIPECHRVALAQRTPGWGFHIVRVGIDQGDHSFCPPFVGVVDIWKDLRSGGGPYPPRVDLPLRTPDWGLHTVQGGVDPRDRFRPRYVGFVDIWNGL